MTTLQAGDIPQLTLGWRLKMALEHGGIKRGEIAEALGVDESTVSRWCAGRGKAPAKAFIKIWAEETRVSLAWLETGQSGDGGGTPPSGLPHEDKSAALSRLAARKRSRHAGRSLTDPYPVAA